MRKTKVIILLIAVAISMNAQSPLTGASQANTSGNLTAIVTTSPAGGEYYPDNVFAIWVQNSSNTFVKTLMAYANARVSYLNSWVTNSAKNKVDAITGATLSSNGIRTATWNGTDVSKVVVADGTYTLKMEYCDGGSSKVASYTFTKGTTVSTAVLSGSLPSCFSNVSIQWVPTNTALSELNFNNQYRVYPNPTKGAIFVDGFDIQNIELVSLKGQSLIFTDQPRLDLKSLPKGIYLLKLTTKEGVFMKKIEKN
jgi:hypothetical protein